jgi:hypothetical protein
MSARIEARLPSGRPLRPWIVVGLALLLAVAVTIGVVVARNSGTTAPGTAKQGVPITSSAQVQVPTLIGGAEGHPRPYQPVDNGSVAGQGSDRGTGLVNDHPRPFQPLQVGAP